MFRWAGGKSWLLPHIQPLIPTEFNNYHEPFLGGGSVFLRLNHKGTAFLSDINADLMNAYMQIKNHLSDLYPILMKFRNSEKDYYKIRQMRPKDKLGMAARFIYLNRTCFNGLYRVNLKGEFNVPYGRKNYKTLFDYEHFRELSKRLKGSIIRCMHFNETYSSIQSNDLVFIDPPYIMLGNSNGFIKYNQKLFSWGDQIHLYNYIKYIKQKGGYYILTNSNTKEVRKLFTDLDYPMTFERFCRIGGKGATRRNYEELVFTNLEY
jgi:DNA adenine methylase